MEVQETTEKVRDTIGWLMRMPGCAFYYTPAVSLADDTIEEDHMAVSQKFKPVHAEFGAGHLQIRASRAGVPRVGKSSRVARSLGVADATWEFITLH
jgi:hypothetical protein